MKRRIVIAASALLVLALAALVGALAGKGAADKALRDRGVATGGPAGWLLVASIPSEARVTVDGRLVGKTPIARIAIEPGTHPVVVEAKGKEAYVGEVRVAAGAEVNLLVNLDELSGTGTGAGTGAGTG